MGAPRRAASATVPRPSHLSAETLERARQVIALYPEPRSALIPLCHLAQEQDGWLTPEAMADIADLVGVTPAEVYGTATFYDMLHTEPVGTHLVAVCTNIACLLNGAAELLEHAESTLGVNAGGTTADGSITLEEAECLADCDRAPVRAGQPPLRRGPDTGDLRPAGGRAALRGPLRRHPRARDPEPGAPDHRPRGRPGPGGLGAGGHGRGPGPAGGGGGGGQGGQRRPRGPGGSGTAGGGS